MILYHHYSPHRYGRYGPGLYDCYYKVIPLCHPFNTCREMMYRTIIIILRIPILLYIIQSQNHPPTTTRRRRRRRQMEIVVHHSIASYKWYPMILPFNRLRLWNMCTSFWNTWSSNNSNNNLPLPVVVRLSFPPAIVTMVIHHWPCCIDVSHVNLMCRNNSFPVIIHVQKSSNIDNIIKWPPVIHGKWWNYSYNNNHNNNRSSPHKYQPPNHPGPTHRPIPRRRRRHIDWKRPRTGSSIVRYRVKHHRICYDTLSKRMPKNWRYEMNWEMYHCIMPHDIDPNHHCHYHPILRPLLLPTNLYPTRNHPSPLFIANTSWMNYCINIPKRHRFPIGMVIIHYYWPSNRGNHGLVVVSNPYIRPIPMPWPILILPCIHRYNEPWTCRRHRRNGIILPWMMRRRTRTMKKRKWIHHYNHHPPNNPVMLSVMNHMMPLCWSKPKMSISPKSWRVCGHTKKMPEYKCWVVSRYGDYCIPMLRRVVVIWCS